MIVDSPASTTLMERNSPNRKLTLKEEIQLCAERYHFTLAHETAHQILASLYSTNRLLQNRVVYYQGRSPQFPIRDWDEWQADNLASALLLPSEIVLGAIQKV